jgi:transposase
MAKTKRTYTPAPAVPPQSSQRLEVIAEVIAGRCTVAQAARTLGMSRNHFQTILHRGVAAMLESITPKEPGRPAKPREVMTLEEENERLKRENEKLQEQVRMTERFLEAASGLLHGRARTARQARTRKASSGGDDDSEGEPRLRDVDRARALGLSATMAAALVGVHLSTVRRWRRACRASAAAVSRRAPPSARACAQAENIVRGLRGQVGAASLSHSVPQLSRREAACVKAQALTQMERERKQALTRVRIAIPGIVRGMDGLEVKAADGKVHALISADAAVPYRTSVKAGRRYDAKLVENALLADMQAHGAPLVYRLDRARSHDAQAVGELLHHYGVLLLHGPPRCPWFYGQLERQNREHRAWDDELSLLAADDVEISLRQALQSLNTLWRRPSLEWHTAAEAWDARPRLEIDRQALRDEVEDRAARIGRELQRRGKPADRAQRLAIEQALETRGYLRQTIGGWC